MTTRIGIAVSAAVIAALFLAGLDRVTSAQGDQNKTLAIHYPNPAIIIDTKGTRYNGLIYVRVFSRGGGAPVATSELGPSQRSLFQLPVGTYEVQFGMRVGSELKTFVVREVMLRPETPATVVSVEMNAEAKTTIIGGDVSIRQIEAAIGILNNKLTELGKDVADLKKK